MEWRPIETAPKDGTAFVALTPRPSMRHGFRVCIAYWERHMNEPRFIYDNWSTADPPTLWAPLPA